MSSSRWNPGAKARFKKTEVCQTCAKVKNVCQTCLLDLTYGLPVEVRDKVLKVDDNLPKSDVNREYYLQQVDRQLAETDGTVSALGGGKISAQVCSNPVAVTDVASLHFLTIHSRAPTKVRPRGGSTPTLESLDLDLWHILKIED